VHLGEIAVLGAALCYAAVKVRLAAKARLFPSDMLAAARLLAAASLAWVIFGISNLFQADVQWQLDISRLGTECWVLLMLSALISGVIATVLQAEGQRVVPPAQAQTIYATVPLFAAAYDLAFLAEPIEGKEIVAGVAILASAALSSTSDQ